MIDKVDYDLRFLSRIKINSNDCWEFKNIHKSTGYGRFSVNNNPTLAHRFSYALFNGDLIKGMMIDHVCRNRKCVNPEHLRQVTPVQNVFENSENIVIANKNKTHCKKGHELKEGNIYYIDNGKERRCRICEIERVKARNLRKKMELLQ